MSVPPRNSHPTGNGNADATAARAQNPSPEIEILGYALVRRPHPNTRLPVKKEEPEDDYVSVVANYPPLPHIKKEEEEESKVIVAFKTDEQYSNSIQKQDPESISMLKRKRSDNSEESKSARMRPENPGKVRDFVRRLQRFEDLKNAEKKRLGYSGAERNRYTEISGSFDESIDTDGMDELDHIDEMEVSSDSIYDDMISKIIAGIPEGFDTRHKSTQRRDLKRAQWILGHHKVEVREDGFKLKDMTSVLKGHQTLAVSWMIQRELARCEPFGGLLADTMGMGKTVMSLACIIGHPPDQKDRKKFCKATLVVVPSLTTARQWKSEIQRHCNHEDLGHWVSIFSPKCDSSKKRYEDDWIVITTYAEIIKEFKVLEKIMKRLGEDNWDKALRSKTYREARWMLFQIDWYRVILDEAHKIKNISSKTSTACWNLGCRFRWALSGTPLSNSPKELFPYLQFLQCPHTTTWRGFQRKYMHNGQTNDYFQALVSSIMMRRTANDNFRGDKILSIPQSMTQDIQVSLSPEEIVLSKSVEDYFEKEIQKIKDEKERKMMLKSDGVDDGSIEDDELGNDNRIAALTIYKQGSQRQVISHPFCVENLLRQRFQEDDIRSLRKELTKVIPRDEKSLFDRLYDDPELKMFRPGLDVLKRQKATLLTGRFAMDSILSRTQNEALIKDQICLICKKDYENSHPMHAGNCDHIYCSLCLRRATQINRMCQYQNCTKKLTVGRRVHTLYRLERKAWDLRGFRASARDSIGAQVPLQEDQRLFSLANSFLKEPLVPSTKVTVAMAVLLTWFKEAPEDKIIVFSQFIPTIIEIGRTLEILKIGFVYFHGRTREAQREDALTSFKKAPHVKIFLSTLHSGGQSLNLTIANRVILIDPWWNLTQEQQGLGRVTRLGQSKETFFVRILARSSIDEKIFKMQERKGRNVDRALQDDDHRPTQLEDVELRKAFAEDTDKDRRRENKRKRLYRKRR